MKTSITLLFVCLSIIVFTSFDTKAKKANVLDKNLSQWDIYQSYRHAIGYNGQLPKNEKGENIPPIGYNKNVANVFSVDNKSGVPILRISGEIYGCLITKQEYENYDLKLKVKFGTLKWTPRTDMLKDAGICYHSIGEAGKDYWRSWMLSQEFQIMEGHMGDYWNIANSAIDIRAFLPEGAMNAVAGNSQPFLAMGTGTNLQGLCLRSVDNSSAKNDWTDIELVCFKGKSLHIVNGKVVMVLANSRYFDGDKNVPLTKGKIQLQSEGAEVFYRDIQIEDIDKLSAKYEGYFEP